ncbi:MAG: hypothetical protein AAGB14_02995, partial [Verrucomicrobiota bacterium]
AASSFETWLESFGGKSLEGPVFPSFIILNASFGIGTSQADVTERINELFDKREEMFRIDAPTLQADPVPGRRKTLTISFIANGAPGTREWRSGQRIKPSNLLNELGLGEGPDELPEEEGETEQEE